MPLLFLLKPGEHLGGFDFAALRNLLVMDITILYIENNVDKQFLSNIRNTPGSLRVSHVKVTLDERRSYGGSPSVNIF